MCIVHENLLIIAPEGEVGLIIHDFAKKKRGFLENFKEFSKKFKNIRQKPLEFSKSDDFRRFTPIFDHFRHFQTLNDL